jgi:hypothetical protein
MTSSVVNKPCCIDIYHGNEVSDAPTALAGLDRVKADGIFALIHKSSEGTAVPDQRYDARREKWMTGNLIPVTDVDGAKLQLTPVFAAYHFFHGSNPQAEAKYFLMMSRLQKGDLSFIDWEAVGASGFQPSIEAADIFCQEVEQARGASCGVYGGNVPRERFAAEKASDAVLERFKARPLWFCAYGPVKELTLLSEPWKETGSFLWQDDGDAYGPGPHSVPGISGYTDNSTVVAPMTFAKLHAQWLGQVTAEPAPKEVPVAEAEQAAAPKKESFSQRIEDEVEAFRKHITEEIAEAEKLRDGTT